MAGKYHFSHSLSGYRHIRLRPRGRARAHEPGLETAERAVAAKRGVEITTELKQQVKKNSPSTYLHARDRQRPSGGSRNRRCTRLAVRPLNSSFGRQRYYFINFPFLHINIFNLDKIYCIYFLLFYLFF